MISTNEDTAAYLTLINSIFDGKFHPEVIVVDKSDAEINAINQFRLSLGSSSTTPVPMVCYFHVLQAINRHMKVEGIEGNVAQVVLSLIRTIHAEESREECNKVIRKMQEYLQKKGNVVGIGVPPNKC